MDSPRRQNPILAAALALATATFATPFALHAQDPPTRAQQLVAATALVGRVVPDAAAHFRVEGIDAQDDRDVFEVESVDEDVVLRGSSGVAVAAALKWYLEQVAGLNLSIPARPIALHAPLPKVARKVRTTTPYRYRYFFNYCTFSYSMAWWDWSQWERMIDWMALQGINMPLSATGQEGTWQLMLRDMGFTEAQIGDFLVGPAYLPWGWMGNIDGLGGPLPQSWIDTHVALERRILERERALGMTPVLQGFTGHVPESITQLFPEATIHRTGDWSAGFSGTWFLDPTDPLFGRMGKRFVERQTELFGTSHYYAADPFNEINPPTDDSTFLAGMGRSIYGSMEAADPSAVWVLQGWFLYYQASFWKDPQARALLGAVPDDRMVVLDLYGDRHPVWKERDGFYGKPWIWNVLYNFGGKVSVNGDLPRVAENLADALGSPDKGRLSGLGMMMEGLGYNPIVPDFVMDQVWRDEVPPLDTWARDYVTRRYGQDDPEAWRAWEILLQTAYRSGAQTGTFLVERPGFHDADRAYRSEPIIPYDPRRLVDALDALLEAAPRLADSDAYQYDVVNLTRQVLGQLGLPWIGAVQAAYEAGDGPGLIAAEERVLALLDDLDQVVGTRPEFLLGSWLEDAKRWGTTSAERDLYEWNARNIITLWGTQCTEGQYDDLNLYAHKQWQGLFRDYYKPKWERFFRGLNQALERGTPFDRAAFVEESCTWEQAWSRRHDTYPTAPRGDALEVVRRMYGKYEDALRAAF